jgi:hypothetical protein
VSLSPNSDVNFYFQTLSIVYSCIYFVFHDRVRNEQYHVCQNRQSGITFLLVWVTNLRVIDMNLGRLVFIYIVMCME